MEVLLLLWVGGNSSNSESLDEREKNMKRGRIVTNKGMQLTEKHRNIVTHFTVD
jgi:hypothetical protein